MTSGLVEYRRSVAAAAAARGEPARRAAILESQRLRRTIYESSAQQMLVRRLDPKQDADSGSQLWFWFNHFNVFWQKGLVGAALPEYLDEALQPHLDGRFRDLLLGVVTHPAMLFYLDNVSNAEGRINENLARELLELHTLGVDGGYTQADVRATALVLTGFGLRPLRPVEWPAREETLKRERGEFLFDPRRHDFSRKRILDQAVDGSGYDEIESLVDLLALQPATARHLARRLCRYHLGDGVPEAVWQGVAAAYLDSGGRLDVTQAAIAAARADVPPGTSFKDPMHWLLDGVALLAAGQPLADARPLLRWLALLGQPLFGRSTPDGYSLDGQDWISSGQLAQRLELAQEIVAARTRLFAAPASPDAVLSSAPALRLADSLGSASRAAFDVADTPQDRLAMLLASPEFMYR